MPKRISRARNVGLALGFRSGFEGDIAKEIMAATGKPAVYESEFLTYVTPPQSHRYTPDYKLGPRFFVETKGRLTLADRKKHLLIAQQHPEVTIAFVFQNPNSKITKGSKTSYGDWATRHGFLFSKKHIPQEWYEEALRR
jgi:hypothetical protein